MSRSSRTLYVGNLPGDIREREVEDLFYKVFCFPHSSPHSPPLPLCYAIWGFFMGLVDLEDKVQPDTVTFD